MFQHSTSTLQQCAIRSLKHAGDGHMRGCQAMADLQIFCRIDQLQRLVGVEVLFLLPMNPINASTVSSAVFEFKGK